MIASGLPIFIKIVCGIICNFTLRRLLIYFLIYKIVLGLVRHRAFATLQINGTGVVGL